MFTEPMSMTSGYFYRKKRKMKPKQFLAAQKLRDLVTALLVDEKGNWCLEKWDHYTL